jgi:SAM-dependent methyltransferase
MDKKIRSELRRFKWASSREDSDGLRELERRLGDYYSSDHVREHYEKMCFAARDSQPAALDGLMEAVLTESPRRVLEIGCGSGWILERLAAKGLPESSYAGTEMSPSQIATNKERHPAAEWHHASGYALPFAAGEFDVAFCYCVIEHCVYPERLLKEMIRVLRPGGSLLLVFPDCVQSGLLPSQVLGTQDGNASALLRRGLLIPAAQSLYDSRIRLRRALDAIRERVGAFPINLAPRCLYETAVGVPDTDAVYIGSKFEILEWAKAEGHTGDLPCGDSGAFGSAAFVRVRKSRA